MEDFFGTFRYSKSRYSVVNRNFPDYHYKKQEREEIRAEYWAPSWLINRVWRIRAVKASFGWSFCPNTYNIIPGDSPVFLLASGNNVKGLKELFSKMEASPFDCTNDNMTPLTVSIIVNQIS